MGESRRGFESGDMNEDLLCNMDENHFVVNCDNGRTLGFRGDTEVKYADVVSGGIGMTMMVNTTGGLRARIGGLMMIFQNPRRSYPINGLQTMYLVLHTDLGLKAGMINRLVTHVSLVIYSTPY